MGSAEGVAKAAAPAVFVEDMRSEDKAHAGVSLPAGLVNLGNTCYMNAALEVRSRHELSQASVLPCRA